MCRCAAIPDGTRRQLQGAADEFVSDPQKAQWLAERIDEHLQQFSNPAKSIQKHGMQTSGPQRRVEFDGWWVYFGSEAERHAAAETLSLLMVQGEIPEGLKRRTQKLIFTQQRNADDAYWATQYNEPNFRSAATGGDGNVVVYNAQGATRGTIAHETGHNLAYALYGTVDPPKDGDFVEIQQYEGSVSVYAEKDPREDFAECARLYTEQREVFRQRFPMKYRFFQQLLQQDGLWNQ